MTGPIDSDGVARPAVDGLGDVDRVPALLDELARGAKGARARAIAVELGDERLVHQGAVAPAAIDAVPRLTALLGSDGVAEEEDLLLVLARIATGAPEPHWHGRVDGEDALAALDACPAGDVAGDARARVAAHLPAVTARLGASRGVVRAAAALLLGLFPPRPDGHAAIAARLAKERDDKARAGLLLCLASWQRAFGSPIDRATLGRPEAKPLPALARAVVEAWDPTMRGDAARSTLRAAAVAPPKGFDATKDLPIDGRRLAFEALREAFPDDARDVGLDGLRAGRFRAGDVLRLGFPVPAPGATWADLPMPDELPAAQRSFLRAVIEALPEASSRGGTWIDWTVGKPTGLPTRCACARRWIGLDPPGAHEIVVRGVVGGEAVAWPAWRWLRRVATGRLPVDHLVAALRAHPDPEGAIDVTLGACEGHVDDLFYVGDWSWNDAVRFGREVLGARADAAEGLLRRAPSIASVFASLVVLGALTRVLGARGEALPESCDAQVEKACHQWATLVDVTREVVAALPPARRDAIVLALPLPASVATVDRVWNVVVTCRPEGWAFLDLADDRAAAARRAADAVAAWTPVVTPRRRLPIDEAVAALVALGDAARPAIAAAQSSATATGSEVLARARATLG